MLTIAYDVWYVSQEEEDSKASGEVLGQYWDTKTQLTYHSWKWLETLYFRINGVSCYNTFCCLMGDFGDTGEN